LYGYSSKNQDIRQIGVQFVEVALFVEDFSGLTPAFTGCRVSTIPTTYKCLRGRTISEKPSVRQSGAMLCWVALWWGQNLAPLKLLDAKPIKKQPDHLITVIHPDHQTIKPVYAKPIKKQPAQAKSVTTRR
jgi:hypothetical protein